MSRIGTLFAVLSALAMIGFCTILIGFVREPDLILVVVLVLAMMVFDFVRTLRNGGSR